MKAEQRERVCVGGGWGKGGGTDHHGRDHLLKTYFLPSIGLNLLQVSSHLGPHKTFVIFGYFYF